MYFWDTSSGYIFAENLSKNAGHCNLSPGVHSENKIVEFSYQTSSQYKSILFGNLSSLI